MATVLLIMPAALVSAQEPTLQVTVGEKSTVSGANPCFLEIDYFGEKTEIGISAQGTLVQSYNNTTPDGSQIVIFAEGTSIVSDTGEIPVRVAISVYPEGMNLSSGEYIIGDIYRIKAFSADGSDMDVAFSPPFTIIQQFGQADLRPKTTSILLACYDYPSQSWFKIEPSDHYAQAWQVSGVGRHNLVYTVVARVSPPPIPPISSSSTIEIQNLAITPATIQPGQTTIITGEAVNTGWLSGEYTVIFNVSGVVQDTCVVKLAPGQRRDLKYSLPSTSEGYHSVQLGNARGGFTISLSEPMTSVPNPLRASDQRSPDWRVVLLIVCVLALLFIVLVPGRRKVRRLISQVALMVASSRLRRNGGKSPIKTLVTPTHNLSVQKSQRPVIEGISGPTHRLKKPGPYKFSVQIMGGKPPYNVEWNGNALICGGVEYQEVELFRDQMWDSGKGYWVFVKVKDSRGRYAQWANGDGTSRRLFTYGITYRGKAITAPLKFPYTTTLSDTSLSNAAQKTTRQRRASRNAKVVSG